MTLSTEPATLRRFAYGLLIVVAIAGLVGRIVGVGRVYEPWMSRPPGAPSDDLRGPWPATRPEPEPTHGDNDRSRWDTARALVENHTYAIGHRDYNPADPLHAAVSCFGASHPLDAVVLDAAASPIDRGLITQDGWKTIDKVLKPETLDFYSSKPPLLATLVAGGYWLLHELGWSITDEQDRWAVVPVILLTLNALPLAIALVLLARLVERHGTTDWGRLFVLAAACFGTFVTTFSVTLNNHTVAAWSALFALAAAMRIWSCPQAQGRPPLGLYVLAGFFAAFTAGNELPALAFAVALFLLLLWDSPKRTLLGFLPAALLLAAAFFITNKLAIGEWLPAYEKFGGPWYNYLGSYWSKAKGIDIAGLKEPREIYALHLLVGHHGAFSLTPIFLLSLVGMIVAVWRSIRAEPDALARDSAKTLADTSGSDTRRALTRTGLLTLGVTIVVLAYYILVRDDRTRNYGGFTSAPRWLIWLTPLWLVTLLPVADWLARRRWGRVLGYVFLAVSVLSVSYPQYNPWRHPWVYNFLESHDLLKY